MQETRYFDDDGQAQKLQEVFISENEEKLKQAMDARLFELQKDGHFLTGRAQLFNAKGKPKKLKRKEIKMRRKQKHAF